jgi:hypothetical protein
MDSNGDNSDTDIQVSESSFSASNSSFSSSFCCKSRSSSSISKHKSLFLLGRWVCQLQQCLKLLLERIQIFQPKGAVKKNLFFVPKVKENLQNVEDFCRKIVVFLNRSAPDYGSNNQNQKMEEEGENGFEEDCFIRNRFCEIAANYFRLRLYMSRVVFKEGGDDADSDPFKQDDDTVKFIRSQYRQMFPKRKRGKRGRSIECLASSVPSTDWFRGGGGSSSISVFKLLDIFMSLLIEESVTHEVDSFEIEDLGSGAGRLERYTKNNVFGEGRRRHSSSGNSSNGLLESAAAAEEGSAIDLDSDYSKKESEAEEEKDAADFWTELAASLLANSIEIDRKVLRSQLQIAAEAAATATASASFFFSSSYDARHPQQNNLETGVDVD